MMAPGFSLAISYIYTVDTLDDTTCISEPWSGDLIIVLDTGVNTLVYRFGSPDKWGTFHR